MGFLEWNVAWVWLSRLPENMVNGMVAWLWERWDAYMTSMDGIGCVSAWWTVQGNEGEGVFGSDSFLDDT